MVKSTPTTATTEGQGSYLGGDGVEVRKSCVGRGGGSKLGTMEQGAHAGQRSSRITMDNRRDVRSSRRIAAGAGDGGGPTDEDEESFHRHFALETPLQQVSLRLDGWG